MMLGLLPALILALAGIEAVRDGVVGNDFRGGLYPAAQLLLDGQSPFSSVNADLSVGHMLIYPVPAVALVTPLTLFSVDVAAVVFIAILLASVVGSLWLLGVRDWRVYGIVLMWPATLEALQTGNLTALLAVLVAVGWRWRDRAVISGLAIGAAVALKLFLWPLIIWLVITRRFRSATVAVGAVVAGLLTVLPFTSIGDYLTLMHHLEQAFGGQSYTPFGLLTQLGVPGLAPRLVTLAVGGSVLAAAAARRSLPLFVLAALLLSPIAWLHYFLLLIVPVALRSPRLSWAWAIPLVMWVTPGTGLYVKPWHTVVVLTASLAAVLLARSRSGSVRASAAPVALRGVVEATS